MEEVTGADKTVDVIVDIFNRVNSKGTQLSKGDLALAKISADWPGARNAMKAKLSKWANAEYDFNLDWLLRCMNTVLTGEAKFEHLHDKGAEETKEALERTAKHIDRCLDMIAGRLGLDHSRVFFGRFAVPVMVRYLDTRDGSLSEKERDKLLFWFVQAGMWGRFSGSTESFIDQDLAALDGEDGDLEKLLEQLRLWHGGLRVEPGHFTGWSVGARFYPLLYLLTRMGEARDWGTGLPLRANMLGKTSRLEVHHIFPKSQLYKLGYRKPDVNALGNYCFLTKDTNLSISDRLPEKYFPLIEDQHPGALASQWIPMDRSLWRIENYQDFLKARKELLAEEANRRLAELLHGDSRWIEERPAQAPSDPDAGSGITTQEDEEQLEAINDWIAEQRLPRGELAYDYADPAGGKQKAVFDLAWPHGIQEELSEPVAILLNESSDTIALASQAGYRCFTSIDDFKAYVREDILREQPA